MKENGGRHRVEGLHIIIIIILPMNFHLNCSLNWINYVRDFHQCHPLHFPLKSQIDVKSFAVAQMDLYWHAAVEFVAVVPIFVVLAVK